MYQLTFRVTKDILDLPPVVDVERTVKLEGSKKLYNSIKEHYEKMRKSGVLRRKPGKILTTLLRLQEATGGFQRDPYMEVGTEKRQALEDIFEDLPPDEPVVVFCRFRPDLKIVKDTAEKAGRSCAELSGEENQLGAWQGGAYDVLAVQIQAGGVGIDLTRAHYAVYYSLGFSLGDYEQSRARLHRPGQTETTYYYHLIAQDSIDEKVYKALAEKKDVVTAILEEDNE
jgi:SNF2 family DNA or RNA helicase